MAHPLPPEIKKRAEEMCAKDENLEVLDPGTIYEIEGKILVAVQDRQTGILLWLDLKSGHVS